MTDTITKDDIAMIVNLIDVCAERGAFKGPELATIAYIREKLVNIHKSETIPLDGSDSPL